MKLYRKTIFFGLIFTMLMVQSEAMAPTLQDQMVDLHVNLEQLKKQLTGLKDGLDTVARRLKGEVDDEKKEEKEEEPPAQYFQTLSEEQSSVLKDILSHCNEKINDTDNAFKFGLLDNDHNCFSSRSPHFLTKDQIQGDIDRFTITLKFKKNIDIFRQQLERYPQSLKGKDIEQLKETVTQYMEEVCTAYEILNSFKDFDDVQASDIVADVSTINQDSHPNDFKVFTKAKITEIKQAKDKANELVKHQGFWYHFININKQGNPEEKARASGRLIDFYLQNLFKDYQDKPSNERDKFISGIFTNMAEMFGLRTQAVIAIYPFVCMNLRTKGFFQCVIDIILAVIGQKSHSEDYYAYKHITNPSLYQLLLKIKEKQYTPDDLTIIEDACNDYKKNIYKKNIRVPDYKGDTQYSNLEIPYTPQGVRTKMEILGMIYAQRILDILSSLQTEADIIKAIIEEIIPFKKKKLENDKTEIDKKIKEIEQRLADDKKKFEQEIEEIQKEISKHHAELDDIKVGDTSAIEEKIKKLEQQKKDLTIDQHDIDAWFEEEKDKIATPKEYSAKEIDLLTQEEIRENEYRSRLNTKISKDEKYIPSIFEQLNEVVENIVKKTSTLNRSSANDVKTTKKSWDGNWKLEDIFRTIGAICNEYATYEKKASQENKEKLKKILENSDTCVHFVLTHAESLRFMIMYSISQNNRKDTDLHKIATLIGALCKAQQDAFPDEYERKITYEKIKELPPLDIKMISAGSIPSITTTRMYLLVEAGLNEHCTKDDLELILKNYEDKKLLLPGELSIAAAYEEWMQIGAQREKGKEAKKEIGDKESKEKRKQELFDATRAEIVKRLEQEKKEYDQKIAALTLEKESKIAAKREEAEILIDKDIQRQQDTLMAEKEKYVASKEEITKIKESIEAQRNKIEELTSTHKGLESSQKSELEIARKALSVVQEHQDTLRQTLADMDLAKLTAELKMLQEK